MYIDKDDNQYKYKILSSAESRRKTQQQILLVTTFFITGAIFYQLSLEGGTNEVWLQQNLFKLTILMLCCIGLWTMSCCMLVEFKLTRKTRLIMVATMILFVMFLIFQDTGATVEKHGLYNAVLFFIFSVPVAIVSISVCCCWRNMTRKNFTTAVTSTIVLFSLVLGTRLIWVHDSWVKGLWEVELVPLKPGCNVVVPTANWGEIFSQRGMSFWTGSYECPHQDKIAHIDTNTGLLVISGCKTTHKIELQLLPSTLNMTLDEKWWAATFQHNILSRIQKVELTPNKHEDTTFELPKDTESIYVQCGKHRNLVIRAVRKEEVIQRVHKAIESRKQTHNINNNNNNNVNNDKPQQLNVLILYFDAIARRHFYRRLPRSRLFLETLHLSQQEQQHLIEKHRSDSSIRYDQYKKKPELDFVDKHSNGTSVFQFWRYHAIEYTTMLNTRALFAGTTDVNKLHLVPPLWETYMNNGYASLSLDNSCQDYGGKYQKRVAKCDHEIIAPFCLPESHPVDKPYAAWTGPFSVRRRCMAGQYVHSYAFDYVNQWWQQYKDVPKFAIASFNEGHEGTGDVITTVDNDLVKFLTNMRNRGDFNNTAVWILSDHGLHMGLFWVMNTYAANMENKFPMLFAMYPNWWLKQNPDFYFNLKENQNSLFTGHDLYETWSHQSVLPYLSDRQPKRSNWTYSLFDTMPFDRDCAQARIRPEKCYCQV